MFLDELLSIASNAADRTDGTAKPVVLENAPGAPKTIHLKIAARHGRQITRRKSRWEIAPAAAPQENRTG